MTNDIHLMVDKFAVIEIKKGEGNYDILGRTLFTSNNKDIAMEQCVRYINKNVRAKVYTIAMP